MAATTAVKNPYEFWECYQHGMYKTNCENWQQVMAQCADLLGGNEIQRTMFSVVEEWETAARHYLRQGTSTYRPWLGHAACCYRFGARNWVTKKAWHLLDTKQQATANKAADSAFDHWRKNNLEEANGQNLLF